MSLYLATALMLFGCLVHFLSVLMVLEDQGTHLTPWAYLKQHPYRAAFTVCSAFIALLVAGELEQLTSLTAILIGYACQDAADRIRQRANQRMNQ